MGIRGGKAAYAGLNITELTIRLRQITRRKAFMGCIQAARVVDFMSERESYSP
jgi:hypothetical protein